jgi:hypothetical protein
MLTDALIVDAVVGHGRQLDKLEVTSTAISTEADARLKDHLKVARF